MSWFKENNLDWIQAMSIRILKNGPVPKHVGFIMDGNRRWAKANGVPREDGHRKCYDLAPEVFQWCIALGIKEATFFALAVNNLQRNEDEVDSLWNMLRERFRDVLKQRDQLKGWGVRIRIIGELSLVPKDLQLLFTEAMMITKDNNSIIFNFAVPYGGKFEITQAVRDILKGVEEAEIIPDQISEDLISKCLYTGDSPEPDLMIRSSGAFRLSEFLLWQTTRSCIYFHNAFWPEFNVWKFMDAILCYQRCYEDIKFIRPIRDSLVTSIDNSEVLSFVNELHRRRECAIEKISLGLEEA